MTVTLILMGAMVLALGGLLCRRQLDHRADQAEVSRLLDLQRRPPPLFSHDMVKDLPEPARRYFLFTIKEGTPLYTVAQISMLGRFATGDKTKPNYVPMTAKQILAAPDGFIWKMRGGSGATGISGSDSSSWTRFWLASALPVARVGDTKDHRRSSFGRLVSEAIFWTPAAVLPQSGMSWSSPGGDVARLTVDHQGLRQSVDVTVDAQGRPIAVVLQRWSNANVERTYRWQSFGGRLSEFRDFGGFMLPTHVEAGNLYGSDHYFPFFIAEVSAIRFGDDDNA